MRFPAIRLVEQTEQKFRHIRDCLKNKTGTSKVGAISEAQKSAILKIC